MDAGCSAILSQVNRTTQPFEVREPAAIVDDGEPVIDYSPEGVDRTLIYESLRRSPAERLEMLQGFVDSIWALRDAARVPR